MPVPRRLGIRNTAIAAAAIGLVVITGLVVTSAAQSGAPDERLKLNGRLEPSRATVTGADNAQEVEFVVPIAAVASEEVAGFEAHHLFDDDFSVPWRTSSLAGSDAFVTFTFAPAAQLTTISIHNLETDQEAFLRYARIRGVEVTFSDSNFVIATELPDAPGRHDIPVPGVTTTQVTLMLKSTYSGEATGGHDPSSDTAVAEVTFMGSRR